MKMQLCVFYPNGAIKTRLKYALVFTWMKQNVFGKMRFYQDDHSKKKILQI